MFFAFNHAGGAWILCETQRLHNRAETAKHVLGSVCSPAAYAMLDMMTLTLTCRTSAHGQGIIATAYGM